MDDESQKTKALLAAGATSAAAAAAVGLSLGPGVFEPLPLWLAGLALTALAGAAAAGATGSRAQAMILLAPILPFFRGALLLRDYGLPPWPVRGWAWLTGGGFGWWALSYAAVAAYAARLAAAYTGIPAPAADKGESDAFGQHNDGRGPSIAFIAAKGHAAIDLSFTVTAVLLAALFALRGREGQGWPVAACLTAFLAGGTYLLGLAQGRRSAAAWREENIQPAPAVERRWWSTHAAYIWPLLIILALLPGGYPVLNPGPLALRFLSMLGSNPVDLSGLPSPMGQPAAGEPGGVPFIAAVVVFIQFVLFGLTTMATSALMLFFLLRFLALRALPEWIKSLRKLYRVHLRFLAAILRLLRRTAAAGAGFFRLRRLRAGKKGDRRRPEPRPARNWPAGRPRRLFARLVIWAKERGYRPRRSAAPREIGEGLAALVPDGRADLEQIVRDYERERYGERRLGREELKRFEEAWKRTIARGRDIGRK